MTTGRRRRCGWLDLFVIKYANLLKEEKILELEEIEDSIEIAEAMAAVTAHLE